MLVSFSVANFRSFATEQVFSLAASRALTTHPDHLMPVPGCDEAVLRAGVIYGANGAGSSNLYKALAYARDIALAPRQGLKGTGRSPFRLADMSVLPSTFELQFVTRGKLYRFGFSVDDEHVAQEWLVQVAGNTEKPIYQRHTGSDGRFHIAAPALKNGNAKLAALLMVGAPPNQSFLASVRQALEPRDLGEALSEVIEWLEEGLTLLGPDSTAGMLAEQLARDPELLEFASSFLKASATGIDRLKVQRRELSRAEAHGLVPRSVMSLLDGQSGPYKACIPALDGADLLIERTAEAERFHRLAIQVTHKHLTREETTLELSEESDGTRRLLELVPALYQMSKRPAVVFIDEIGRGLHPMLVYKLIEQSLGSCSARPCQIIVTTHDTHLLTLELLRRDEVWFVEKDPGGASHLYALTDLTDSRDLITRGGYLQGRFGGVPFLGDIDRLVENHPEIVECP
jgi:hypothetical protein